jgi:transglutaminase-like putative cysteine protease
MLIKVHHETHYTYDDVVAHTVQRLALTPLSLPCQTVIEWSVDAPGLAGAPCYTDAFGNVVHLCTQVNTIGEMLICADGTVNTHDCNGVVGHLKNDPPPRLFLRRTDLSAPNGAMKALAEKIAAQQAGELERMHLLMTSLHEHMRFDSSSTHAKTTGCEAFSAGHGVCQDFTHIFISMARHMGLPARYVTGYLLLEDEVRAEAQHAWAEVWFANLGWVGFDAANNICPTDRYIRLCCGLDAASAAPIKGLRLGTANENLSVLVDVQQTSQ